MGSDDLTCRELVELVTDYLEGSLSPLDRRRFELHLDSCRGCSLYLVQMRMTIQTVGRLTEEDMPAPVLPSLLETFRRWKQAC